MRRDYDDTKDDGSEIYVVDNYYPNSSSPRPFPHQQQQQMSPRSPSALSYQPESVVSMTSKKNKGGIVIDSMSAPNPFCPGSRGVCCTLLLVNLGLILVTLGFSIVLQLFEPAFVWYCGVLFLIVGFIALISSLVLCVQICKDSEHNDKNLYWTHHWQKKFEV